MTRLFSDELTPVAAWDVCAAAGVLTLMLPPWMTLLIVAPVAVVYTARHLASETAGQPR